MKDILVGFDGTGCTWEDNTNVRRVVEAANVAGAKTFFFDGVGTKPWNHIRGSLLGVGSFTRLERALFLVSTVWEPGDRIWSIGFSRGGAAAIGFSNLVNAVGVGPGIDRAAAAEAVKVWQARQGYRAGKTARFRGDHGLEPESRHTHFVGCFDPVAALGAAVPRALARAKFGAFSVDLPSRLHNYFAILALDEHRGKFMPILQDRSASDDTVQVWTPGSHGDVGGSKDQPLAGYSLELMLAAMASAGLPVYGKALASIYAPAVATSSGGGFARVMGKMTRRPGLGHAGELRSELASLWMRDGRCPDNPAWEAVRGLEELR